MSELTVDRLAQGPVLSCSPETTVVEAVKRMYAARCSSIVVFDGGRLAGIWTEKDVLAVDLTDPNALLRPMREVMSSPVKTLPGTATVGEATRRLKEENIRHFVVVDGEGAPVGMISQTDIVLNQGVEYFLQMRDVQSAVARGFLMVEEDMLLSEAARRMRQRGLDAAAVSFRNGTHGILTERDVVRLIVRDELDGPVGDYASRPLISVPYSASLYHARNVLAERHIRHLGVSDDQGQLIALLAFPDILSTIEQGYVHDLRATLRKREEALTLSRGRLRLVGKVFESTSEGIVITDADGVIQSANPAFQRLTGYEEHEMVGRNARMFSSGRQSKDFYQAMWQELREKGYWKGEIWNRKKNGEIYLKTMTITGIRDADGAFCNYAAVHSDVVSHEQSLERIHYLANHDALTGLPNRAHFNDRLIRALEHSRRYGGTVGVLVFDLDRFRMVNETLGYLAGDELLQAVAAVLVTKLPSDCLIARLHADEFAIIVEGAGGADEMAALARELLSLVAQPMTIRECLLYVTASVGISLFPNDGQEHHLLLQNAHTAAEQAKAKGRNTYQFFTERMNEQARRRLSIETELRRAIEQGELVVHYQPKVDMRDMIIVGTEALVRWDHPQKGLLSPAAFIPVAEEAGLISAVNEYVLETACHEARTWHDAGFGHIGVAVNLSPCQFRQRRLLDVVRKSLIKSGLPAHALELEITENMAMEDPDESFHMLSELVGTGVSVSIDDFGTGYSSFAYLKRYPVSALKIDRSFVCDLAREEDVAIPRAIISMAHSLGMKVVAEGIETEYQLEALRSSSCDLGQGFLFSRPLPPERLLPFCRTTEYGSAPVNFLQRTANS